MKKEKDKEALEYLGSIQIKLESKLNKLVEKHDLDGVMNENSIRKIEHELSLVTYIQHVLIQRLGTEYCGI